MGEETESSVRWKV